MDLKLLRAFMQLSDAGHYGTAASRLFVTQSTLSKQIQALEHQVGGALFERGRHGAKLTPMGSLLLKEAGRILKLSDEIESKIAQAKSGLAGHLNIGFGISTLELAPRLITTFRNVVPDCEITLNDISSSEQHRRLRDGTLDLGFCRAPSNGNDLSFLPILKERLALVVPQGARPPPMDYSSMLNRIGFVSLSPGRGSGLTAQIGQWCSVTRFEPRIVQYAEDILTIHSVVAAGLCVAFLPSIGANALGNRTDQHPLDGEMATWFVGVCWRVSDNNKLLHKFLECVASYSNSSGW